ncbi:MAG: cytochrome C [Marinilabiliales bacterium]|nr:MAG: cytochrome C [Marinilabiliales bacterium]
MIINGFVLPKAPSKKGFYSRIFGLGLFILLLINFPQTSFSQTAADEANFAVCKACHTIGGGRLVGPDLKGVNERHDEDWLIKFIQNSTQMIESGDPAAVKIFEEYNKIPMPPNNLTADQIRGVLKYIANDGKLAEGEAAATSETLSEEVAEAPIHDPDEEIIAEMKRADFRNMRNTFIIVVILMLISIFDLLVTKFIKARWIHFVIILITIFIGGELIFVEAAGLGRQQYYQPDQPIAFSHKVHAGQNKIDCQYCHFTADKSMHAGIPPAATCMNCHSQVKEGKTTGKEEIAKIYDAIDNNKPIEWIKVHNLPDHVYFNHAQHVTVGKVACAECHGEVEKMDEIIQVNDLSMGWCIECHRTKDVQFANNKFYDNFAQMHEKLKSGEKKTVKVIDIGGEECQRCHY